MASSSLKNLLNKVQCGYSQASEEEDIFLEGEAVVLENHMTDFLLVGKCICETDTVNLKYKLEHSPDGVRWSPVKNENGVEINFTCQSTTSAASPQTCAIQVIDTPLLPYVRGICGDADVSDACECTLDLHYTSFK